MSWFREGRLGRVIGMVIVMADVSDAGFLGGSHLLQKSRIW
jgi:hypothetical protein